MKKRIFWFFAVCVVLTLGIMLASCGGSAGKGDGQAGGNVESDFLGNLSELPAATPATYQKGTEVIVTEATIGDQGGTLTGPAGTPVEGIVVTVPAGALSEPTVLSMGYDNGTFTNVKLKEQAGVIVIHSGGATNFQKPLTVTYPFTDPNRIPVPYYINPDGKLEIVAPLPLDRDAGRGGFKIWHASDFTRLNSDGSDLFYFNGFIPSIDGFAVDNTIEVKYSKKGRCYGMSNFSRWYKQKKGGGLAGKFLFQVSTKTGDRIISGQEIIATRAHNSVQRYSPMQYAEDHRSFIIAVKDALSRGAPAVMVGLGTETFGHSVLAIGYTDNQIALYDPNHPGKIKAIDYTLDPPKLSYGSFKYFFIFGNGELPLNESYEHLLQDADAQFRNENETKIEVTSHQPEQKVASDLIVLEGKIHSGQVLIDQIETRVLYPDGTFSEPVTQTMTSEDNTFKLPQNLKEGLNTVLFKTRGYVAFTEGLQLIPVDPQFFRLELTEADYQKPGSSISVTAIRTDNDSRSRTEITVSYSSSLIYSTDSAQKLLDSSYDYGFWCDSINSNCEILHASSYDSLDYFTSSRLPVQVESHMKKYDIDLDGKETLIMYADGEGTLDCESVQVGIHVEPGSNYDNRKYRLVVKRGDICFPQDQTPMITGKYKFSPDDPDWHDLDPEPLTLGGAHSYAVSNDRLEIYSCENPPQILPGEIEPWIIDQSSQKSWVLTGKLDGCDYNNDGRTRSEEATVNLTLVPE